MTTKGYQAEQNTDGTWNVRMVPVFSAAVDDRYLGPDGKPTEYTAEWLNKALANAQRRHARGYYPPLHVRHHPDDEVRAAGQFQLVAVDLLDFDGKPVPTVFADLLNVPDEVYQEIRAGKLVYRSVEIHAVDKAEIDSLALLDHEVPFFRYPLLRIATETAAPGAETAAITLARGRQPALAFSALGARRSALMRYQEANVTKPAKPARFEDAPEDEEKKPDAMSGLRALQQSLQQMATIVASMLGESDGEDEEKMEDEDKPEASMADAPSASTGSAVDLPAPVVASLDPRDAARDDAIRSMQAELAALKREREVDREAASMTAKGYTEAEVGKFRSFAASHGLAAARDYARHTEGLRGASAPPASWGGEVPASLPAEVTKFADKGPDVLEQATSLYRSWQATGSDVNLADFISANLNPTAMFAEGRR